MRLKPRPVQNGVSSVPRSPMGSTSSLFDVERPAVAEMSVAGTLAYLRDETVPVEDRHSALGRLAGRVDEDAVNGLIGVAEADSRFREHALVLLAGAKSDLAAAFLTTQMTNEDERVVCRAVEGLAANKGADAIPAISNLAESNRHRPGGASDAVWASCAKALGEIRSSEALPVIERELKWVGDGGGHMEYGSQLVAALELIGDSRAANVLQGYADQLQASLSGMPKVRQTQMVKIMEARNAAEGLK